MEKYMDTIDIGPVIGALLTGLTTDGEKNKQYYLEKALCELVPGEWVEATKADFAWESGVETL